MEAEAVAGRLLESLSAPILFEGSQMQLTASIGIARLEGSGSSEAALRQADVALYAAKRNGRNGFAWYDEELEREISERLKLEEDIRGGIKAGEFVPFFQPLVDLTTRKVVGFEALARWRSVLFVPGNDERRLRRALTAQRVCARWASAGWPVQRSPSNSRI